MTSFSQLSTSPSASVSQPIQSPQQQPQHPGHSLAQSPSHSHTLSQSHSRTPSYSSGPPPLPSASPATANQTKILLLANFSPELKTRDIQLLFGEWEDDRGGLKVKWIDDSSCWIVFNDASVAKRAFLTLLSSPPAALQPSDGRSPKLSPYNGPDVAQILTSVQTRPRSRSNASSMSHSRKGSLLGSGGGHARVPSLGRADAQRNVRGSFGAAQTGEGGAMEGGAQEPLVPAIPAEYQSSGSGNGNGNGTAAREAGVTSGEPDAQSQRSGSPPVLGDAAKRHMQSALGIRATSSGSPTNISPIAEPRPTTGADAATQSLSSLTIDE